ncbi:MAG: hypothetical protein PHS04_00735 [Tissierellia bacterium]|nr:hypothetical protein [Tissierellia bacterium]
MQKQLLKRIKILYVGIFVIVFILITSIFLFKPPSFLMKYSVPARQYITENILQDESLNASTFGYKTIIDTDKYTILKRSYKADKIVAAYGKVVILLNSDLGNDTFNIYPDYNGTLFKYQIKFSERNFPGLIQGSKISHCMIIPYMRNVDGKSHVKSWRLIIVTDKGQVYHNFPAREKEFDGYELPGDITLFEESVVWDLPGRLYPSTNEECDSTERYYPGLSENTYNFFPILNTDESYIDSYGNGGFAKTTNVIQNEQKTVVSRFYFPLREGQSNSFFYMSGYEPDPKMSLIGTYRSNTDMGVRTVIFASDDGGRQWFCKYEFGDFGKYEFQQGDNKSWGTNFGNSINSTIMRDDYKTLSFSVTKRNVIAPSQENKEPENLFTWEDNIDVTCITKAENAVVTTKDQHNFTTGNIVAFQSNTGYEKDSWHWMLNDSISETSAGNGLLFKVDVIDDYSFRLYEYVASPNNHITCRHIHHINRIKDGWIIGTGEIYPNGWLLYLQMKEADTFTKKSAREEFKIIRLNSSEQSVQRTLGLVLYDDRDSTIIYASDHDLLKRDEVAMPEGRTETFDRSSTGVFKGTLNSIDDIGTFEIIYEAKEPAFFFKKLGKALVFSGQRGEFAVSFDNGDTWHQEQLDSPLIYFYGHSFSYYVISDYIIIFK